MASDPKMVARKAAGGGIDGFIAALIFPVVIAWIRTMLPDSITPDTETAIATTVGVVSSIIAIAAKRAIGNWWKHK